MNLLPIRALDLIRGRQKRRDERPAALNGNEDEIDGIRHCARLVAVRVEAQVDGAAEDLPDESVREPVPERLAAVPRLRVRDGDGGLGGPEDARRYAAQRAAEEHEPVDAEAVVGVEARGVGGVAEAVGRVSRRSRRASGGTYVPKMRAPLMPMYLVRTGAKKHDTTMRQKVMALAALTTSGLAAPPAPRLFMAPQMPGAERLARPRMVMLKKVERYHFTEGVLELIRANVLNERTRDQLRLGRDAVTSMEVGVGRHGGECLKLLQAKMNTDVFVKPERDMRDGQWRRPALI